MPRRPARARIAACRFQADVPVIRDDEPMNKSVVSFTKQTGQVTPYWLLQQFAAIDAVLIFKFADSCANLKYDVPVKRQPRANYLHEIMNGGSDDFKLEYLNEIWDILGLPRNCPVNAVSELRVPLYPIFSGEFVSESLDKIPNIVEFGSPPHLQRIELEAIRNRILRIKGKR
jgi:hypothetical protein